MDFDLRLKALNRLAQSETAAAIDALRKELDNTTKSLTDDTEYESLEQSLKILGAICYRFPDVAVQILSRFIHAIESRHITYSQQDPSILASIRTYQNASSLTVRATEVLIELRYLYSKPVLRALLTLSIHKSDEVRKKALEGLTALSNYDIAVFYGQDKRAGIGAWPQRQILEELDELEIADLRKYFTSVIHILDAVLSPMMQGTSWSYKSVTLSRAPTPGHSSVADVRRRSIEMLKRLYTVAADTSQKVVVLNALNEAARTDHLGKNDDDTTKMIVRDTIAVLQFFKDLLRTEELSIVQNIEAKSYWIFVRAIHSDIEPAALAVEAVIAAHSEYQIYKVLIGFEGIFGDWVELRKTDSIWEKAENDRKRTALEYVASITSENYAEWRERILNFAKTESNDLATFPIFYYFLESFAATHPKLALQLVAADSEKIANFLIPLLRGLWAGPQKDETRALIRLWLGDGRHLYAIAKQFLRNENLDREILLLTLSRSEELRDLATISLIMSVAVSNYNSSKRFLIEELFLPALEILTKNANATWIYDIWFRRETRIVINDLAEEGLELILRNLFVLENIDYHAEEILYLVAQRKPEKVLQFLCERLEAESEVRKGGSKRYDAIPYELHKLNEPLSKIPNEAIHILRQHYDGDSQMFVFRGAHLLKTVFPHFPPEFQTELLSIVREGGDTNFGFVLAVLRNYEGQPFIHQICKEIIRLIPIDSSLRTDVAIVLENTGVVVGEFGFAEAYERKKNEVKDWLNDPDEKIQDFAKWYIANLDELIVRERKRAEEDIALRKFRYGDGDSE
jgi:hypothetical protein